MEHLSIHPVKAFKDNYIWTLIYNNALCVVDPGDAQPIIAFALQHNYHVETILITHHHNDHIGGITELKQKWPNATVVASKQSSIHPTQTVNDGDIVTWQQITFTVLTIPGHTLDHIAFFSDDTHLTQPILFCGDTLFAGGCGRVFEGTMAQMHNSLQRLANLPNHTLIYCAHEYTLSNLQFACMVDPNNIALKNRYEAVCELRNQQLPTLPSTLKMELDTNPFLRCSNSTIQESALQSAYATNVESTPTVKPETIFTILRSWKNAI